MFGLFSHFIDLFHFLSVFEIDKLFILIGFFWSKPNSLISLKGQHLTLFIFWGESCQIIYFAIQIASFRTVSIHFRIKTQKILFSQKLNPKKCYSPKLNMKQDLTSTYQPTGIFQKSQQNLKNQSCRGQNLKTHSCNYYLRSNCLIFSWSNEFNI